MAYYHFHSHLSLDRNSSMLTTFSTAFSGSSYPARRYLCPDKFAIGLRSAVLCQTDHCRSRWTASQGKCLLRFCICCRSSRVPALWLKSQFSPCMSGG